MPNLNYILSKKYDETFTISFSGGPQEITGNGAIFKTDEMFGITTINTVTDISLGETTSLFFTKFFKYKNGENWSDMILLSELSGTTFDVCNSLFLELYYYKTINGQSSGTLSVNNITITGNYQLQEYDSEALLPNENDIVVLAPKDVYKIFSLSNFQVISRPHNQYEIKYRFTQDNGRTFSEWTPLTTENISTQKLNPLRFAMVEYSIKNLSQNGLIVYDIILEGDFQNVSANYLKTNRYGLKEDCITGMQTATDTNMPGSSNVNRDFYTQCLSTYNSSEVIQGINNQNATTQSTLWNPYQFQSITNFYNMLGNQVSNTFGWAVDYHLSDPDNNGIDRVMNEYTLKNIVDVQKIKVIVPDNKFPIETMIVNQFNLDLFDTFEIHIMKDAFKNAFGIDKRPSQDDYIYICEANMLYYVKHAQAFKNIMNSATYYKVILEKYEYKTNMRNLVQDVQEQIDALTDNTTIDSLFGNDIKEEGNKIANKEQFHPTTFDIIRQTISSKVTITKETLFIDNFDVAKQYYNLSSLINTVAIKYTKADQILKKSDNRSFILWSNFNNSYSEDRRPSTDMYLGYDVKTNVEYNLLNNYDTTNSSGYKIYYQADNLHFKLNDVIYKLNKKLFTNVWYVFIINLNQRQQLIDLKIYRRNIDIMVTLFEPNTFIKAEAVYGSSDYNDLINLGYKPANNVEVNNNTSGWSLEAEISLDMIPTDFSHTQDLTIIGSDIKYTNLRVLNEVIPNDQIENIMKENIITDGQNIILADNANRKLITSIYYTKNFR